MHKVRHETIGQRNYMSLPCHLIPLQGLDYNWNLGILLNSPVCSSVFRGILQTFFSCFKNTSLSFNRFSSVTERFFMELNSRRIDTSAARSETLGIFNGMRYLKLGVRVYSQELISELKYLCMM